MKMVSVARRALPLAVLASSLCFASLASAALTSRTQTTTVTPTAQSATVLGGVSLQAVTDQTYSSYNPPTPATTGTVSHFDDDFVIDTTGLTQCSPAALVNTTTAAAIASCPGARVGSGSQTLRIDPPFGPGTFSSVLTLFNGPPSGANPTLLAHSRFEPPSAPFSQTFIATCVIEPSSLGGDFGLQSSCGTGGGGGTTGQTQLATLLDNIEPAPGHHYLSARCADGDQTWNFLSVSTYSDASVISSPRTVPCQVDEDTDGDGIAASVDTDPGTASNAFDDGGSTSGSITDRGGLAVTIEDSSAAAPHDGVHVVVGAGSGEASIDACGFTHVLTAGTDTTITCASTIVNVAQGEVKVLLPDGLTVVSIPAGVAGEVTDNGDGTSTVENLGGGDITVTVDGTPTTVGPGATVTGGVPTAAQQCKKNGWRLLNNGSAGFRNQGACVSFVNGA